PSAVAILADGKITAGGFAANRPFANFALARYNTDGTLDNSFGTGGKVTTDPGGVSGQAYSLAVQPDGKIVLAGYANVNGGESFMLARYNTNGTLDQNFGTRGIVTPRFALAGQGFSFAFAFSVAIQPDGRIVAAGQHYFNGVSHSALARYNSNGTLDASFGTGGIRSTLFFD